jgi:hypothetical protein
VSPLVEKPRTEASDASNDRNYFRATVSVQTDSVCASSRTTQLRYISPTAYQKLNCGCPVMSKMDEMEIGNIGVMG